MTAPAQPVPNAKSGLPVNNRTTPASNKPHPAQPPIADPILATAGDGVRNFFDFSINERVNSKGISIAFSVASTILSCFMIPPPYAIANLKHSCPAVTTR